MPNKSILALLLLAYEMTAATGSFAEAVRGNVTNINPDEKSMTIAAARAGGTAPLTVWINKETLYHGIDWLHDLRTGDEVILEGEQEKKSGRWVARSITIDKVKIRPGETAAENAAEKKAK